MISGGGGGGGVGFGALGFFGFFGVAETTAIVVSSNLGKRDFLYDSPGIFDNSIGSSVSFA